MNTTLNRIRQYKAVFITDSRGYDEPVENLYEMLRQGISKVGGKPAEAVSQGRIEFQRVTDKEHTGDYYVEISFTGPSEVPGALQEHFRLERRVKRLVVEVKS